MVDSPTAASILLSSNGVVWKAELGSRAGRVSSKGSAIFLLVNGLEVTDLLLFNEMHFITFSPSLGGAG